MQGKGPTRSRRDVLRTAAAVGAAGLISGCVSYTDRLPLGGSNHLSLVPDGAESVTYVDANAILEDEAIRRLTNAYIDRVSESDYYDGPDDYEEALDDFEDETDLPLSEANYQVSFTEYSDYGVVGDYYGTLFDAEWSEDDVVDAYEENYDVEFDDDDYEDRTIYVPPNEWTPHVGVVSEGTYVTGEREAIEDVIDIDIGDDDPLDDPLKTGYKQTRNAPVRWVGEMAPWIEGDTSGPGGEEFNLDPFQDTDFVAGSVYADGNKRGAETTFRGEDEDTARDIEDIVSGYISLARGSDAVSEEAEAILDESTVERKGTDVVVGYEATIDELVSMLEEAMEPRESSVRSNVQAGVSVQTEGDQAIVTWTSNQNAYYLTAEASGCNESAMRLDDVGDSVYFTGCSGSSHVVVTAYGEGGSATVIVSKTLDV